MQTIMARRVPQDIYARWLGCLYHIYTELEYQLGSHQDERVIQAVDDPTMLRRLPNITEDLEFFLGADIAKSVRVAPSLHTIRYVSRISDIGMKPHLLLVHHWVGFKNHPMSTNSCASLEECSFVSQYLLLKRFRFNNLDEIRWRPSRWAISKECIASNL